MLHWLAIRNHRQSRHREQVRMKARGEGIPLALQILVEDWAC